MHPLVLVLLLGVLLVSGCTRGPRAVLDPVSRDPGQDHWAIASYYSHQAAMSRQQAEELTHRAMVYEGLFGRESEWVTRHTALSAVLQRHGKRTGAARRPAPGTAPGSVAQLAHTITRVLTRHAWRGRTGRER